MKIHRINFNQTPNIFIESICIGKFDGLHHGHQTLITKTKELSPNFGILTFNPPPFVFFQKNAKTLFTEREKIATFQSNQIPNVIIIEFDAELSQMGGEDFCQKLSKITKNITVGEDFQFGKNKNHNTKSLVNFGKKFNFNSHIVKPQEVKNSKISSGMLRFFIEKADFSSYNSLSTQPFFAKGTVISGKGIASTEIKVPTANINIENSKIMPPHGVYITQATIEGKTFPSISNFGTSPTFNGTNQALETNILQENFNLYGKEIDVIFLKHIRPEIKFENINQLKLQILQDIQTATTFHNL